MATIRAEHLYKVFGRKPETAVRRLQEGEPREAVRTGTVTPAVIDVSFEAAEGETFVVMGLSGSGKSTLIRMLNGILPATAGSVFIDDDDVTRLDKGALRNLRARRMSMVFQHFALFPHRTVLDNAAYGLEVRRASKAEGHERAREALSVVGLEGWEDSYPEQLSGGMKQRVGLARALATDNDIMLMDEAFSALDPLIRREMQDQLIELQHRLRKTIVFITHDLNEAMKLGDRIAMMRDGRIEQIGTAEEILNNPANDYVATFIEDVDRSRVLTASTIMTDPIVFARQSDGARAAHDALRANGLTGLYVLGDNRQVIGSVTEKQLAEAVRAGDERACRELATPDVATARPSNLVVDLFGLAAESTLPLAVTDEQRRLLGVVSRAHLLAALDGGKGSDHESSRAGLGGATMLGHVSEQPGASQDTTTVGQEV